MRRAIHTSFRIGDWRVEPASEKISRDGEEIRLDLRTMDLLLFLAERSGEVVSIESLTQHVWNGVSVSPDSVYQSVMSLRRLMGDDAKHPKYIATIPRRGYRLIAAVTPCSDPITPEADVAVEQPEDSSSGTGKSPARLGSKRRIGIALAASTVVCAGIGVGAWHPWLQRKSTDKAPQGTMGTVSPSQKSVAVLPFQDLTEGMKQGEFTDGMTEEVIDQLSKVPGLTIPSPTASFYFKDKQIPLSALAQKLGVVYVLDGSVRKSGSRVRVAARLMRADTGYVMWSETYDRPWHYTVMVQDEIAESLTKAVRASLEPTDSH